MWDYEHTVEAAAAPEAVWRRWADVATWPRVERLDGGRVRIVYRTEITGPGADALGSEIGPAVTADFPETMAALVRATLG